MPPAFLGEDFPYWKDMMEMYSSPHTNNCHKLSLLKILRYHP